MSIQSEASSSRLLTGVDAGVVNDFEWIDSESLAGGFRSFNNGLAVPEKFSNSLDRILKIQSQEVSPFLSDHQLRVGGYAGAILGVIFPEYNDAFHIGLVRVAGAFHDYGKYVINRDVMFRSIGVEGYGTFERNRDMPEIIKHTEFGFELLMQEKTEVPEEVPYIAFLHHQFPNKGHEPYGMDLSAVDKIYKHDPEMSQWIRSATEAVSIADYFDATSRSNGYFSSDEARNQSLINYVKYRQPEKYQQILLKLTQEKMHYQTHLGRVALVA